MPGYLGGSGSSGGVGGVIKFATEFIDPVTKLRVSQPENLIDTDFEYGLQPTKWETVELINNTPSFFSKSGDTTIDGIVSVTTNAGTREITVTTALEHGLAVGIPIQVTGTKSITADGSYIINSIPNSTTFTYLCKDNQPTTAAIEDLYTSIITGEFFQGSQLRISDADGITTDGAALSTLTVTTESTHGFGVKTPFYFLNLNSTISQEFPSANNTSKSFDASNSATAQTFDGSNTLSSITIDLSNSAVIGGATSTITSTDPANDRITVQHGAENFANLPLGAPLYYNVLAASGFFAANPRGVVFLKSTNGNGASVSSFQVSEVPDGPVIDITGNMSGTFQSANQARTFAGNNVNPLTEVTIDLVNEATQEFDATNTQGLTGTVIANGYSGSNVTITSPTTLDWYPGTMVFYSSTGTAATGLTNNTTYFVDAFFRQGSTDFYSLTLKTLPNSTSVLSGLSGGSGTQTFTQIGVSLDKNVFHLRNNGFLVGDMVRYDYPVGGHFGTDQVKDFYFIQTVYDAHNFLLSHTVGEVSPLTVSRTGTFTGTAITPTTVTTTGFEAPLTWAVTSGTLPTGLSLNTSTGVVSGTPSEAIPEPGREVVITVTDSTGNIGSQTLTFQFNPAPELYSFSSATFGSSRGLSGPNDSNPVSGSSFSETRQYFSNTGQTSMVNLINNGTFLSVPGAAGYIYWRVPATANYRIVCVGGGGGPSSASGGRGARVEGTFSLAQGDTLWMTVGLAGASGNTGGNDRAGAAGGGMSVVAQSSSSSTSFNGSTMTPLLVAAGGQGSREPRFGFSPGPDGDPNNGGSGNGFFSNWRSQNINGSGAGYGGMTTYGGFGGGTGTDDFFGPAGGYDGLYTNSPNSYVNPIASSITRTYGSSYSNGFISITKQ